MAEGRSSVNEAFLTGESRPVAKEEGSEAIARTVANELGIAIGAGTNVAIESADLVLVDNDPEDVLGALALSKATYRKMVQNLAWATGYRRPLSLLDAPLPT